MKLSFIIPAYNEEAYIGACLDSITRELERTDVGAEIIVADNGSTDGTVAVARRYPHVRVVSELRKGANRARQAGFAISSGELIVNLDADTLITPRWIPRALKEFSKNRNLVALSGPYLFADLPLHLRALTNTYYALTYPVYLLNTYILRRGAFMMGGNAVIRRTALETIGGYNTSIAFYGDDTDTANRLARVGKVKFAYTFTANTSGRRIRAEGALKTAIRYVINYLWMILFNRPFTKRSVAIRART